MNLGQRIGGEKYKSAKIRLPIDFLEELRELSEAEGEIVFKSNIEEAETYDYSVMFRDSLINFFIDKLEKVIEDAITEEME